MAEDAENRTDRDAYAAAKAAFNAIVAEKPHNIATLLRPEKLEGFLKLAIRNTTGYATVIEIIGFLKTYAARNPGHFFPKNKFS